MKLDSTTTMDDYTTVKYDANGNQLWVARYDAVPVGDDRAYSLTVDDSNNVYVTGNSRTFATGDDYATIKYDTDGNRLWVARYNGPGNGWDWIYALAVDNSGSIYVTGESIGTNTNRDFTTIKYIQSPVEALAELTQTLIYLDLQQGVENNLNAKLQNVLTSLDSPNSEQRQDSANKVQAFINSVAAQAGKGLTEEEATLLIEIALEVIDLI